MGNTEFRAFFWNGVKSEFNILRSNKTKLCISTSKLWIQYNTYVFNYFFFKSSSQMSQDLSFTVITKRILREKICSEKVCSHFLGIRFRNFLRIFENAWKQPIWWGCICILQCFQFCSHQVMVKLLILCNPKLTWCSVNLIFFFPQRLELNEWRISEMKNYTSVHYYPIRKPDQIN